MVDLVNYLGINNDGLLKTVFIVPNIYYPRSPDYTRYYDIIELWNDKLGKYAKNNGLKILNIDDKVDKKHYFTHDIEPSASGSSVIIDNILKL